jgi:hypothetical protein
MTFNRKLHKLDGDGILLANDSNVSLQGIEDVSKTLDDLKTYLNRAYAKEKWKGYGFEQHVISPVKGDLSVLVLVHDLTKFDDHDCEVLGCDPTAEIEYNPDAEPVFAVCDLQGNVLSKCTTTTNCHGTTVDMGDLGYYKLDGSDAKSKPHWTFYPGDNCADQEKIVGLFND